MSPGKGSSQPHKKLLRENEELRAQLAEAQETLRAICEGEVDAVVVSGSKGEQIFSLSGTESIYRLIVETMKEAAFTVTIEGTILYSNAQFGMLIKRPMEQILGHSLQEFVDPANCSAANSLLALPQKQSIKQRLVFADADGGSVPAHISANVLTHADGPTICVVATDLSDLEKSTELIQLLGREQEALKRSEKLYRAIGESIDYGVWVCAADGRNIYASESFLKMVGITQQQCSDFGWGDVLHPDDAERTIESWKECVRTGGTWDIEHRFRGVDGEWHHVLARGVPVRDEGGEVALWAGINLDISRMKQAEESLRVAMAELDQRVQERTKELSRTIDTLHLEMGLRSRAEQTLRERSEQIRLLSSELTMAEQRERQRLAQTLHDGLQQILVVIKFRLALMQQQSSAKKNQHLVTEMTELIDEAIDASRSLTVELSPPVLHERGLVPALEWLGRWMLNKHGLSLDLKADAHAEPPDEDAKVLLFQTTRELLFNVVKHAGVKRACVRLTRLEGRISIIVEDEGDGFDPDQLRAMGGGGGGFGLFSIGERVYFLGGKLVIDSAPGKGSRISVVLPSGADRDRGGAAPVEPDSISSVGATPRHPANAAELKNGVRILIADDHTVTRQGLVRLLKEVPGFEIVGEASDGKTAVNLVREVLPDVVLMDISMPGMNGIQATQIIRAEFPHIRVVGLSMFDGEEADAMCAAGAARCLAKTGPADAIITAIHGAPQ
jgi:PAS domain S-box-containing protein